MVSQKLQELFTMLRYNAEEMLDEIMLTMSTIEEEEELVREGVALIANICSINDEKARQLIVADTARRRATARNPQTPEADKIASEALGSQSGSDDTDLGNLSLVDIVTDWAEANRNKIG